MIVTGAGTANIDSRAPVRGICIMKKKVTNLALYYKAGHTVNQVTGSGRQESSGSVRL